jgi:hypothetical protein
MEYYNECLNVKITLDLNANSILVQYLSNGTQEIKTVSAEDFNEIYEAMQVPGFGLGMILIKIGKAFERAVTGS